MSIVTIRRTVAAAMLTLLVAAMADSVTATAAESAAEPIAIVNGTPLSREDLNREMHLVAYRLTRQGRPVDVGQLKIYEGEIRDTLIQRTLLQQQSQALGMEVSARLVDKALNQFKTGFGSQRAYQRALAEMGFSEASMRAQIKTGLTIKQLLEKEVVQKVTVTAQQVRVYYEQHPDQFNLPAQVKASHILIEVPENADTKQKADALATIQSLQRRIDEGENFAVLAQQYSDCPSRSKGGDLGFFGPEQMVPSFSQAAFALKPGQVSDVVQTRFGFHLIRVTERRDARSMAFGEVREDIALKLRQEKEQTKIDAYLRNLTENAEIDRFSL